MFTNKVLSRFFTLGQVIETHRGGGIFQPAIDEAVKKLQDGSWVRWPCEMRYVAHETLQVHIFPEGRVNQPSLHPEGGLWRFKWGV
jgi:monolysocardiolipin acyltransferase